MHDIVLDIVVLFGLVLSFFLVCLILFSKSFRSDVHWYFAITITSLNVCLMYTWFGHYMPANGIVEILSWDFLFPFSFLMYVLKAIKSPLANRAAIHLLAIPFILLSLLQIISFFFDFDFYDWLAGGDEEQMMLFIEIRLFSFLPFSIALIGGSHLAIRRADNIYPGEKKWLQFNSLAILAFLLCWLFSDAFAYLSGIAIWEYLLVVLAIFLVVVTYLGVHHLNIAEQRRHIKQLYALEVSPAKIVTEAGADSKKSTHPSRKALEKVDKLDAIMRTERLYLQADLSRKLVAKRLDISEGYLSEILKNVLETNFNDYVNKYRVEEVIWMFEEEKFDLFSIEAIGYEAGFKTKSVFYTAFKKVVQQPPGAYRKAGKSS
ncbi:MAG: helix-turn-helix domain-containing protein [Bacteroidota bacterium]